jgi:hypothetical protein
LGGGGGRRLKSNFEGRITLRERRYAILVTTASQVISSALICRAHGLRENDNAAGMPGSNCTTPASYRALPTLYASSTTLPLRHCEHAT